MQEAQPSSNFTISLVDPSTLPDDPAILKELLATLLQMLSKEITRREEVERNIDALLKKLSRSRGVQCDPNQRMLFDTEITNDDTSVPAVSDNGVPDDEPTAGKNKGKPHGRRSGMGDVPIVEVIHDLPETLKAQFAAGTLIGLPDVVTYQYDYQPGKLIQIKHIQKKYVVRPNGSQETVEAEMVPMNPQTLTDTTAQACSPPIAECASLAGELETSAVAADTKEMEVTSLVGPVEEARSSQSPLETPALPIDSISAVGPILLAPKCLAMPSCLAGPGLLALIWLSKFGDHLPLYRQTMILQRYGIHFARSTLCDWMLQLAIVLKPLYQRKIVVTLQSRVMHTDDTTVVRQDPKTGKRSTARFWNYIGDEEHPLTVYQFTLTHERTHPATFLQTFQGYLQADAYNGYDGIYLDSQGMIIEVGCWQHARKRFKAAMASDIRASIGMAFIKRIYAVERKLRPLRKTEWAAASLDEWAAHVAEVRQRETEPVLKEFEKWLQATYGHVLPKTPLGDAIRYTLNQWTPLTRFTQCGLLDPDNNEAERSHRSIAIGRKNWIMVGSDRGGEAAAIHFSFIASCKMNNIDPFAYLVDVLNRLPSTPPDQLDDLLPHRWKPLKSPSAV